MVFEQNVREIPSGDEIKNYAERSNALRLHRHGEHPHRRNEGGELLIEIVHRVDYIAVPYPNETVHQSIGESLSEACARANVTLAGGETATLPGIVNELDLSGTALGWLPAGEAVTGESASPGDPR